MRLADSAGTNAQAAWARGLLSWTVAFLLAVVAVSTELCVEAENPARSSPSETIQALATGLETGDFALVETLLHRNIDHRDLASGAAFRGRRAWESVFRKASAGATRTPGIRAEVFSTRLLAPNVAIADLGLRQSGEPGLASWPRHTAVLLLYERGIWSVVATRAGGNYEP